MLFWETIKIRVQIKFLMTFLDVFWQNVFKIAASKNGIDKINNRF